MNVSEVMSRDVKIASPEDTLQHAAQMMEGIDAGSLPVGENDRLIGILTDRDITLRAVARGKAPDQCKVRDVMSASIKYVYEDDTLEKVAKSMGDLQVRRLPVLDRQKRLVGIVSLGDLALKKTESAGKALKKVSEPEH
jgi:CBS domain-containing protein